jgi:CDP-4-dehydro-6-deoxyglucose reductase
MPLKEKREVEIYDYYSHSDSTKSFFIRFLDGKPLDYQAGQFLIAHIPRENDIVKRAYSIASSPLETQKTGLIEICLNRVELGYVSNWMHDKGHKTIIHVDGPHGRFTVPEENSNHMIFCGTGTGISPIRGILKDFELKDKLKDKDIWLFFGVRFETDILYHQEFQKWADHYPSFHYVPSVSRPVNWKGETGYVQNLVKKYINEPGKWDVYACGLNTMIKELEGVLLEMGFDKKQIHYDKWG